MDIINLTVIEKKTDIVELDTVEKHNPYHGKDGRFTSGPGGAAVSGGGTASGKSGKMTEKEIWDKSKGEKLFSYMGKRCHAAIVPGLKEEDLPNQKKHSYIGTMDGYEIYNISASPMLDQFGFAAIKKSVEQIETIEFVEKYNPYHDSKGRFTSAGGAKSFSIGSNSKGAKTAIENEKKRHDAEIKAVAGAKIEEAVKAEPGITKNLTGIAAKNGATMVGLEYKLKTAESLERKVRTECVEKGITPKEAIKKMYDVNRYTMQADESNFTSTIKSTFSTLEGEGYKVERVKNTFQKGKEYVAVNCVLSDKNGTRFELQFHTKKSLEVKEVNHKLYEEQRADSTPAARRKELGQIMANNTNSIPIPEGIETVESFSKL